MGAEGSDEDYCEELQQPEEEVTLDVCQSSRAWPLPKAGAAATGPPAADPPCRANEPSCRLAGQRNMLAWLPSAGAHKAIDHLQTRPRKSGGITSDREMSSRLLRLQEYPPERCR